jgi:large subunit ribosomal protein L18
MKIRTKADARRRIKHRIRKKIAGTRERPRLSVFKSLKHIYAQLIDDEAGRTLVAASSRDKDFPMPGGENRAAAAELGKILARKTMEKGIQQVVFDRSGYPYHGRVKTLAEAAREGGLRF